MKEEKPHIHRVLVEGHVIYEGEDWQHAFFEAAKNPHNGAIVHTIDGQQSTFLGPNVRLYSSIAPFIPPVQSVLMHHPAFIRGYKGGRATTEPHTDRVTDDELVNLFKTIFEPDEEHPTTKDELYYQIGNIMGMLDAQMQYTLYKVVSMHEEHR